GDVLDLVVVHFAAHGDRDLLGHALGDIRRAGDLFGHAFDPPHLAGGRHRSAGIASVASVAARIAAGVAFAVVRARVAAGGETATQVERLASARVEARIAAIGLAGLDRRAGVLAIVVA